MYKLKVKRQGKTVLVVYCDTMQEVAEHMARECNASTLAEILKAQKEYNARFYVTSFKK